ncbi:MULTISPECIES: TonB-dependent receptor [Nitrincola]|uniref:TonB-dependent receptor Fiu n=1 Tax=Nitrincola nitratireducens TaxID=1229521 RepID=W9V4X9_9GAMM|nr:MULTISPECIES: TonB-dependent siderophore receptor [Nitrincola]EXJ11991.1 TonB-dependent receptor Fiu [Nitrincola nitratireducens]
MQNHLCCKIHTCKPSPLALAIGSALSLMVTHAYAQTDNVQLPTLEVSAESEQTYHVEKSANVKLTQDLVDTPKTLTIVNDVLMHDQGVTNLQDALRNVAGVSTFAAGEGGGGNVTTGDTITIRGFDVNGSIYTDGIRDLSTYSRDIFNTEQIEVAKGSSGSLYGKGSAGGTVNLVTKSARTDRNFNTINLSYDQGELGRITGDFNHQLSDDSALRINLLAQSGGDYLGNGEEDYQTLAIASSYFLQISDKTDLTLNLFHMQQDNTPVMGLPFVNAAAAAQLGMPEGPISKSNWGNYYGVKGRDFEEVDATSLTAIINHEVNDAWNLRSQTRIGTNERQSITTRPALLNLGNNSAPNYDGSVNVSPFMAQFSEDKLFVTQLDAIGEVYTGSVKHDLVVGAEVYRENKKIPVIDTSGITLSATSVDLNTPDSVTATGSWQKDGYSSDTTAKGIAAYFANTATLNQYLQLSAGLRYEDFTAKGYKTSGGQQVHAKTDADLISWQAGINFKPLQNGSLYASISNSEQPNATDLVLQGNANTADAYAKLDPLESVTKEIGTKWVFFDDRLLLGAALFETTKDVYDTVDNQITTSGEQRSRGFELSATGQLSDELSLIGTYTRQNAKVTEDAPAANGNTTLGNGLTAAPDQSASLWMTYAKGPLTLGAGAEYNSGNTYWRQQRAFYETGSVTLVNAMASYEFTNQLKAQLNVSNLTDKEYVTDYSARGHFKPGDPRNIKLSLNYNF